MGTTPNYNFNVPVGSDIVNLLTQNNPNWSNLDAILKTISNTGVGTATELKTGTVHSLTRSDTDRKVFTFVATTNFVAGETFLLDGEQVTALTASGEQLSTGCYVIGSNVLVSVHDTLLTFYVPESTAKDAQKLGGELPSHYATEADLEEIQNDMTAVETKLGTGVFQTQAQNAVDAINELNTHLLSIKVKHAELSNVVVSSGGTFTLPSRFNTLPVLNVGLKNNIGFAITHWAYDGYWCAYAPSNPGQTLALVEVEYLDVTIVEE